MYNARAAKPSAASERSFWSWCAAHPPLQRLHICVGVAGSSAEDEPMWVAWLRCTRPVLQVHCHVGELPFVGSL